MALCFFAAFILALHYVQLLPPGIAGEARDRDLGDDRLHHLGGVLRRQDRQPAAQSLPAADHRQRADPRQADDVHRDGGASRCASWPCITIRTRATCCRCLTGASCSHCSRRSSWSPTSPRCSRPTFASPWTRSSASRTPTSSPACTTCAHSPRCLSRNFKQAMRYSHPLSIVMIDCDNLKQVNDTHGHESGNRLLQHVARGVRSELRGSDVLARYGGDEFIALLPETGSRRRARDGRAHSPLHRDVAARRARHRCDQHGEHRHRQLSRTMAAASR